MRIAIVSHTNAPWTGHYARSLTDRGHTVVVVSFSVDALEGVDVAYVSRPRFLPRGLGYLAGAPRVRRVLRSFAPDVIFATYLSSNGLVAALVRGRKPLVVSARGGDVLEQDGYLPGGPRLHGRLVRFVCRRASAVHAVSDELVDALRGYGIDSARIQCFPVGVDVSRYARRLDRGAAESPLRIVSTRRQEPVYGNDTLVEALGELRRKGLPFRATLVGGGPLLEERRSQIRALGLETMVVCTGQLEPDAVSERLREADIYVSTSMSDGTSSSLLEALASGLLPVVSAIRANRRWVRDGETGLTFTAGDPMSLARALERALMDDELRARARVENRRLVEREGNQSITMARLERLLGSVAA